MSEEIPAEALITRLIHARLKEEDVLGAEDRESIAYRIAEVMVTAKALYTELLPRLIREKVVSEPLSLYDELAGLRMSLLHLRDLVTEYDEAFFDAMHHQREDEGVAPLPPPDDEDDENEDPNGYEEEDEEADDAHERARDLERDRE